MKRLQTVKLQRQGRTRRARARSAASEGRPRLSVFRSLKHISGQIIDEHGHVLAAVSDTHLTDKKLKGVERARATGKLLGEQAKGKKIENVVFDKSHYKFHGRVLAFAEGAREGGLVF